MSLYQKQRLLKILIYYNRQTYLYFHVNFFDYSVTISLLLCILKLLPKKIDGKILSKHSFNYYDLWGVSLEAQSIRTRKYAYKRNQKKYWANF